jgi:hypothetical protein
MHCEQFDSFRLDLGLQVVERYSVCCVAAGITGRGIFISTSGCSGNPDPTSRRSNIGMDCRGTNGNNGEHTRRRRAAIGVQYYAGSGARQHLEHLLHVLSLSLSLSLPLSLPHHIQSSTLGRRRTNWQQLLLRNRSVAAIDGRKPIRCQRNARISRHGGGQRSTYCC